MWVHCWEWDEEAGVTVIRLRISFPKRWDSSLKAFTVAKRLDFRAISWENSLKYSELLTNALVGSENTYRNPFLSVLHTDFLAPFCKLTYRCWHFKITTESPYTGSSIAHPDPRKWKSRTCNHSHCIPAVSCKLLNVDTIVLFFLLSTKKKTHEEAVTKLWAAATRRPPTLGFQTQQGQKSLCADPVLAKLIFPWGFIFKTNEKTT